VSRPTSVPAPSRRVSRARRALFAARAAASGALALLTAHAFVPLEALQISSLLLLGAGLVAAWIAVLVWHIPVLDRRRLAGLAALWLLGIALSATLVVVSSDAAQSLLWRCSVNWLAMTLSLAVGALFLRALLRVRTSPLSGRLLSLVSPFAILALIVVLAILKT